MKLDIKRILVPLDFSAHSTRTLDYAHGLALEFDAALHLIHVCETPSMTTLDAVTGSLIPTGASVLAKKPSAS